MTDDIRWETSHCSRMDHGGCALKVGIKGNRVVQIKGDPDGYLNKGYTCLKGRVSPKRLNHPDRLRHPLKRSGERGRGTWREISWSEAIGEIADNLGRIRDTYGAKAVVFGQGMPKGLDFFVINRLATLFGTPNLFTMADLCHLPREVTGVHTCGFYPVADLHHPSDLLVLWGSNITATNEEGQVCRLLLDQVNRGKDLLIIDPRKTELADKARLFLQIRPGSDAALALAFLHVIILEGLYDRDFVTRWTHGFDALARHVEPYSPERVADITWVPAEQIREAAGLYAGASPALIQWGNALEQNIYTFDTIRALICLMAVCGNLDVPGGNIQANDPHLLSLGRFVRADQLPDKRREMLNASYGTIPKLMAVPPTLFRRAVLEGRPNPVKGVYMQYTNPLVTFADSPMTHEALTRLAFLAVSDIVMTPTAAMADIVLPAATTFEYNDIGHYGLGHGVLLARPKLVDPPEDCWPDPKILNELGKALSPGEFWFDDWEDLLGLVLEPTGLTYEEFVKKGYLTGPPAFRKYLDKGFRTPTGKVELELSTAEKLGVSPLPLFQGLPEEVDPDYPLVLISSKSRYYLHSSYRWVEELRAKEPHPRTEIHPDTAAALGIQDGDEVILETSRGAITQVAHLTPRIHPGVVNAAYGWWFPGKETGGDLDWTSANYNMLTSAKRVGKEFATPNLRGIRCRVRKKGGD